MTNLNWQQHISIKKATEQHKYTTAEIEELQNEGYMQEAVTQILAWATSD